MSKAKRRHAARKTHAKKVQRRRDHEIQRIDTVTTKLMPLLLHTRHDAVGDFQHYQDLKLWRLPDRRLNPHDRVASKRYIDAYRRLRTEPRHATYNLPVIVCATHVCLQQLKDWRKDLEQLLRKLRRNLKQLKPVPAF